jgi:hypothetical protein
MKKQVLHYCRTRAISLLRLLGKGDDKIAVVFAANADSGHEAVSYLTKEIPGLPVWLFSTMPPRGNGVALQPRFLAA